MKKNFFKIIFALMMLVLFSSATLKNASAGLLADYSTTSAGGNLASATFTTGDWVSDVHFSVYNYSSGDPIAGESGYQDFGPPYDITACGAPFAPAGCFVSDFTSNMTVNNGEYLYVYQIDHDVNAAATLTKLNVGLFDSAKDSVTSIGFTNDAAVDIFGLGSGINGPNKAVYSDITRSAAYTFMSDTVDAGNSSYTLFYTSTLAPTFHSSSLFGNSTDTQLLPSPAPEPVSSILFITGAATLGFRRFRKNRNV